MGLFKKSKKNIGDTNNIDKVNVTEENNSLNGNEKEQESSPKKTGEKLESDAAFYIEDVFRLDEKTSEGVVVAGLVAKGVFHEGDKVYQIDDKGSISCGCIVEGMERPVDGAMTRMKEAAYNPDSIALSRYGIHLSGVTVEQLKKGSYLLHFKDDISETKDGDASGNGSVAFKDENEVNKEKNGNINPDVISPKRKDEIGPFVLAEHIEEEQLKDVTIQELAFLIRTAEHFNKVKAVANYEEKKNLLYKEMNKKLLAADELFITIDRTTNMPFINCDTVDVYSKKSFALNAVLHYLKEYRDLMVVRVPKDNSGLPDGLGLFAWLYYLGADRIVIDNGQYTVEVKRDDILPPPDYSDAKLVETPVENPKLRFAINRCLSEVRWPVDYPERKKVFEEKNESMIKEILNAKYLIPMRIEGEIEQAEPNLSVVKKDSNMIIPTLTNSNNEQYQAVFTDWTEFRKLYDKEKWSGLISDLKQVYSFAKDMGIVINPLGENLIISGEVKEEIKERLEK